MTSDKANIAAFLAGILFSPPCANTTARLVAGPDVIRFNRLFDSTTEVLMAICRDTRLHNSGGREEVKVLAADMLADLMIGLALQLSLIASYLVDCQAWETDDFKDILKRAATLPPPLKSVFEPDLNFWVCFLRHPRAPEFLAGFETIDETDRIRCVAVLTCSEEPDAAIDQFVEAPDKMAFVASRLLDADLDACNGRIDDASSLKYAIAWSIAASDDHPTLTTSQPFPLNND